ncbi:MAG: DUF1834 family protein [Deltaproteobacteria bacterium]|nr:MAG: DUF1834 family protein [Deltaproteobacteria bacterium]
MNYGFDDYEAAILQALASLNTGTGGYLKTLKGYAGELDEDAALDNFIRGFPGVLVEVSEATYDAATMPFYLEEATVNLLVGSRSYRSEKAARGGSTGAYTILKDLRRLLLGKTLGLEIRPLQLVRQVKMTGLSPRAAKTAIYLAEYRLKNDYIAEEV